ncbi:MAG: phytoene synthase [Ignavibacteriae bacterium HGW-Ignavibacteriae-4]|jgi:phytoene/squalene synthetase|nr:MAG: phytoene synthase [Ignavibacteriae bacterium HGW-Ignavibacteriae-4]
MKDIYTEVCLKASKIVTTKYSTSFSIGIMLLDKKIRDHIYSIYGFVRLADEIVDTFHEHEQEYLLNKFEADTYEAIEHRISMNPVLHSFQRTVHEYNLDINHIDAFLESMRMDLKKINYDKDNFEKYIYGSAQVVGLMCLQVYVEGNKKLYEALLPHAISLGSAFQKVNFIRDLKDDINDLGRSYFPNIELNNLNDASKKIIEADIEADFDYALIGISKLPKNSKYGVYTAYLYYLVLLRKIKSSPIKKLMKKRVRVSNFHKLLLLPKAKFNISINRL